MLDKELIKRAKSFVWLINKRNGGANEIDIFNLIDIYLGIYGDNYKKQKFDSVEDEFRWLFKGLVKAIDDSNKPKYTFGSKVCVNCKEEKLYSEYTINRKSKDGLKNSCRICQQNYQNEFHRRNPDKLAMYKERANIGRKRKKGKYEL